MNTLLVFIMTGLVVICSAVPDCSKPPNLTLSENTKEQCCPAIDIFKGATPPECQSLKSTNATTTSYTRNACFVECVLNKTGVLTNGEVDLAKVNKVLVNDFKLDNEVVDVMGKSFAICIEKAKDLVSKMSALPPLESGMVCSSYSVVMMACVFREIFINCPASKWQSTEECNNIKNFFTACQLAPK